MNCGLVELRHKEVINCKNGCRIGFVDDLIVDTNSATICSLVIYGKPKCFGIFGRREDCIIPWSNIDIIGEDTILVNCCNICKDNHRKKGGFLKNF